MTLSEFVEDAIIEIAKVLILSPTLEQRIDIQLNRNTVLDFYNLLLIPREITEKQSKLLLRVIKVYGPLVGIDMTELLLSPKFKTPFRVIDETRRIFLSNCASGGVVICFKFPFYFKEVFHQEFDTMPHKVSSTWNIGTQSREIQFFNVSLLRVYEFGIDHKFELDTNFLQAVAMLEESILHQDMILPVATVDNHEVNLSAACPSAVTYFDSHKTGIVAHDLFLAKQMGFAAVGLTTNTPFCQLVSSTGSQFWIPGIDRLLSVYQQVPGKLCVILDRADDKTKWLREFVNASDNLGIDRSRIKVCFREEHSTEFNAWLKHQGLTGKVEYGDIFICNHKPPKWIFSIYETISIVATTLIIPSTSQITRAMLESHTCTMYVSDIKPTIRKELTLVKL